MGDGSGVIDTSGDRPSIRAAALASSLTATIITGWWIGFLEAIEGVLGGPANALADVARWIEFQLIASIFNVAQNSSRELAAQNAQFLSRFGIFAQAVALVEIFLIVLVVGAAFRFLLSKLGGAAS